MKKFDGGLFQDIVMTVSGRQMHTSRQRNWEYEYPTCCLQILRKFDSEWWKIGEDVWVQDFESLILLFFLVLPKKIWVCIAFITLGAPLQCAVFS